MSEFESLLENLKYSDMRIASYTRQIKEMEQESNKITDEIEKLKMNENQTLQDIELKRSLLDEKLCEQKIIDEQIAIWKSVLEDKLKEKETAKQNTEQIKNQIWSQRIQFFDKVNTFVEENDLLIHGAQKIQTGIVQLEAVQKIESEINQLNNEVEALTSEAQELLIIQEDIKNLEEEKRYLEYNQQNEEGKWFIDQIKNYKDELNRLENSIATLQEGSSLRFREDANQQHIQQSENRRGPPAPLRPLSGQNNPSTSTRELDSLTPEVQRRLFQFIPKSSSGLGKVPKRY